MREGDWKPLNPGYDFLKMIDDEERRMNNPDVSDMGNNRGKKGDQSNIQNETAVGPHVYQKGAPNASTPML